MPIDLYYHPVSPPSRAAMLTAKALGVTLNLKKVAVMDGEQMKPEYLAINFMHTIPTMVDGDFTLWESRAICCYLVNQYGKDDSLYPSNPRVRALVDQRLYFDIGTLYQRWADYAYAPFLGEKFNPKKLEKVEEALEWLNTFLVESTFAAGNEVTVADHSLVASVATLEAGGIDLEKYPRITSWLKQCKSVMPGYNEVSDEGMEMTLKNFRVKFEEIKKKAAEEES